MRVSIVFETRTGTTAAAAEEMAGSLRAAGHDCTLASVFDADPGKVSSAEAICIGTWTKGYFIVMQHPTEATLDFIRRLSLRGQPVAVFTTYRLAVGGTLRELAMAVESSGGTVTGMYKSRGPRVPQGFEGWVRSLQR